MRPKAGGRRRKIWKASKGVWKPCNPLKSHKTAKDLFGKAWSKTPDFWRSLEKGLEGAVIPPPLAPSTSGLRSSGIVTARSEATKQPGGSVTRPLGCFAPLARSSAKSGLSGRKSGRARFIQGDRPEDGAELATVVASGLRQQVESVVDFQPVQIRSRDDVAVDVAWPAVCSS